MGLEILSRPDNLLPSYILVGVLQTQYHHAFLVPRFRLSICLDHQVVLLCARHLYCLPRFPEICLQIRQRQTIRAVFQHPVLTHLAEFISLTSASPESTRISTIFTATSFSNTCYSRGSCVSSGTFLMRRERETTFCREAGYLNKI